MKKIVLTICAVALSFVGMAQTWTAIHGNGFSTTDIYGNEVNVADTLAAGKFVLVDYSATWCGPCWSLHNSGILEAIQANLGDQVCVLWVESESRNGLDQIYGLTPDGTTYADATQGNWTLTADGDPVPYPVIDCSECESMIDPTGYIPAVYFVSPTGYFCHVYQESYGFGIETTHAVAVQRIQNLMANAPHAGQLPVITISGENGAVLDRTFTYSANVISVDAVTSAIWTVTGGTIDDPNANPVNVTWNAVGPQTLTYTVTNTTGTTTATLDVEVADCGNTQLPYVQSFDNAGMFSCWENIDNDGDGLGWYPTASVFGEGYAHSGAGSAASASYINNYGALTPDNWLISPAITLPAEASYVEWWSGAIDASYPNDHYSVLLSTTGNDLSDFTTTLYSGDNESKNFTRHGASLADYAGQTVYFALRHHACTDIYWLLIDDFKVSVGDYAGINDVAAVNFSIYPNPASDKLTVRAEGLHEVSILDVAGRTVATSATNVVDLTSLSAGVYMVRVVTANGTASQKFVKE